MYRYMKLFYHLVSQFRHKFSKSLSDSPSLDFAVEDLDNCIELSGKWADFKDKKYFKALMQFIMVFANRYFQIKPLNGTVFSIEDYSERLLLKECNQVTNL